MFKYAIKSQKGVLKDLKNEKADEEKLLKESFEKYLKKDTED